MTTKIALIDGDVLLYRCGFAAQKTEYYAERRVSGSLVGTYSCKKDAVEDLKRLGVTKETVALRKRIVAEPFAFAAHTVKLQIQQICNNVEATEYKLYLSPNDRNIFRYQVAVTVPYKGTRTGEKPIHYNKLREYMLANHPHVCMNGIEADDALSIDQDKEGNSTVICSIDKDLLQVPGLHYNFISQEIINASYFGSLGLSNDKKKLTGTGLMWFYAQMLLGDRCDNIKGIDGFGPVSTYMLLTRKKWTKEQHLVNLVRAQYPSDERFIENALLLWLLRNPGETYIKRKDYEAKFMQK